MRYHELRRNACSLAIREGNDALLVTKGKLTFWYGGDRSLAFSHISRAKSYEFADKERKGKAFTILEDDGTITWMQGQEKATHVTWSPDA